MKFLFFLWSACHVTACFAQQTDDCTIWYEQATQRSLQSSPGMSVIEYGVQVVGRGGGKENKVKIYSDSAHRYILMDILQVYMDKEHSILLAPAAKTIMINYTDAKARKSLEESHAEFADSLLRSAQEIIDCKQVSATMPYDREMTVKPKSNATGILKSVYYIKSKDPDLYKVSVFYKKGDYDQVDYTFYQNAKGLSNEKINKPVVDLFFRKDGTLLPAYKGYHITDNRKVSLKN